MYRQRTGRLGTAFEQTARNVTVPASVGGVNALDPLLGMPPTDCIYTYNLMPSEYGLRLRKGYREWATGCGSSNTEVRTIIPFSGQDTANDKLWGVTQDGIYDVTSNGTTSPTEDVTFTTTTTNAGYGVWTEMTLDTGAQVLFYADAQNGLHQYTESTATWTVPSLTGPTVANIVFVNLWKQRLWVVEDESGDAYYGPVDGISGTFTKFTFGSKFRYGGEVVGIWPWTIDGGAGVDDFLVAVSRGGDVLVYQGSDPSLGDFGLVGSFFIGEIPDSRRIAVSYGGELYLLSTFGVISVRDLLNGVDVSSAIASPSAKINRILRAEILDQKSTYGWSIQAHPPDGFLQIMQPFSADNDAIQYNQNLLTKAWGYWSGMAMKCGEAWNGEYYMGDADGRVLQYYGDKDNTTIAGATGSDIDFSILTSFQGLDDHAAHHQAGVIRMISSTAGEVSYSVSAIYDYDIVAEAATASAIAASGNTLWDTGLWDAGTWDASTQSDTQLKGGGGMGRTFSIAMKGYAGNRFTFIGWDVTIMSGGFM